MRLSLTIAALAALGACDWPGARAPGQEWAPAGRAEPSRSRTLGRSCQTGRADPARVRRVRSLLGRTRAGRSLLDRARTPLAVCFADAAVPMITTEGKITLGLRETDAENAARLAHLLQHAIEGPPLPDDFDRSRSCSSVVRDAIRAEARAHALELQLRRELGATDPRRVYPFERDFWSAPVERRIEALESFFRAHPRGGRGLPAFVEAFTRRCIALKRGGAKTEARAPARREMSLEYPGRR